MIALLLVVFGFFTFFSVFSTGSHHATQTKNRAIANLLAQSYLEEFKAHTYGDPAPKVWEQEEDNPLKLVISDREQQFKFHKIITYENGSFVDSSKTDNTDRIKLVITWREAMGDRQAEDADQVASRPDDNKKLEVEVPVWR